MTFKLNRPLPRYTGFFKKQAPEPEPAKFPPINTEGMTGDKLRISHVMNWTSDQIDNPNSVFIGRNEGKRSEVITLTRLCLEYLQDGTPAGRVIDRLEKIATAIDPNFKPIQ